MNINNDQSEMHRSLQDVRKAYRLLHDYQRLTMDAAHYIGTQLGYNYNGGWPRFSNAPPRAGYGNLDLWAWDWLNMVFYEFHFLKDCGNFMHTLSLMTISDSGVLAETHSGEPEVSNFDPVNQCDTLLAVIWSRGTWKQLTFLEDIAVMQRFARDGGVLPAGKSEADQTIYGRCYSVSALASQESTDGIIDDLIQHTQEDEVPFVRASCFLSRTP